MRLKVWRERRSLALEEGDKAHPEHQQGVVLQELLGHTLVREDVDEVADQRPVGVVLQQRLAAVHHHVAAVLLVWSNTETHERERVRTQTHTAHRKWVCIYMPEEMVLRLHLYNKRPLQVLYNIAQHSPIHTQHTHISHTDDGVHHARATASSSGAVRLRCLAQGHLDTR